ncbi:MAG: hypothetical protein BGO50_14855 [Rhodanobacter sp. 67-28]|nr:MAG: hypothetical protein ABS82_07600 [Rhodanobacter sp. SCN 67-45]OJW40141.1 MAG: hypothetical protein BGO50_14855 [Rhodanobacter sp. 67-28]
MAADVEALGGGDAATAANAANAAARPQNAPPMHAVRHRFMQMPLAVAVPVAKFNHTPIGAVRRRPARFAAGHLCLVAASPGIS